MATKTLGTNGTDTLTAINAATGGSTVNELIPGNFANISATDFATIQEAIKNDKVNTIPARANYALTRSGLLYVPNRGVLQVLPGDWIGIDATGWPILVGANAIASLSPASSWTHS